MIICGDSKSKKNVLLINQAKVQKKVPMYCLTLQLFKMNSSLLCIFYAKCRVALKHFFFLQIIPRTAHSVKNELAMTVSSGLCSNVDTSTITSGVNYPTSMNRHISRSDIC